MGQQALGPPISPSTPSQTRDGMNVTVEVQVSSRRQGWFSSRVTPPPGSNYTTPSNRLLTHTDHQLVDSSWGGTPTQARSMIKESSPHSMKRGLLTSPIWLINKDSLRIVRVVLRQESFTIFIDHLTIVTQIPISPETLSWGVEVSGPLNLRHPLKSSIGITKLHCRWAKPIQNLPHCTTNTEYRTKFLKLQ
jgi:hypothetical protein